MKKIVVISILFPIITFAGLNINEVNSVLLSIHSLNKLKFYSSETNNAMYREINFTSYDNADILLFPKKVESQKTVIVSSYEELKNDKNSIGAIYLKKNRTQIIFIKERLENKSLTLPEKFNNYIVPSCYLNSTCI